MRIIVLNIASGKYIGKKNKNTPEIVVFFL